MTQDPEANRGDKPPHGSVCPTCHSRAINEAERGLHECGRCGEALVRVKRGETVFGDEYAYIVAGTTRPGVTVHKGAPGPLTKTKEM